MSIRHSLLTILAQGPCYGYQLRTEFDRRTGSTWPVNVGQIYNTLDRLTRDALVTKSVASSDDDPEGNQYAQYTITEAGTLQANQWLLSPVERYSVGRDELVIKLAIAVTLPGVDAHEVIERQRQATRGALDALVLAAEAQSQASNASEFAEQLVADSMRAHAEAELRWLDSAEASLTTAIAQGRVDSFPIDSTKPKRGRPAAVAAQAS